MFKFSDNLTANFIFRLRLELDKCSSDVNDEYSVLREIRHQWKAAAKVLTLFKRPASEIIHALILYAHKV